MATLVKGDKIKEGSIPLSALEDNVKQEINAKYGLNGYLGTLSIDNKTINTNLDYRSTVYIKFAETIVNVSMGVYELHELFPNSAPIPGSLDLHNVNDRLVLDLESNNGYWGALKVFEKLNDVSNTVVKTTPQELTDNAKNQALANLGIDPVVWKYICNPYAATENTPIPEEVHNLIITDSEYGLKPIITNILLIDEFKVISATNAADVVQTSDNDANYMYNRGTKTFTKM